MLFFRKERRVYEDDEMNNLGKINIGALVKYHRQLNKLTQGELCKGICSIAHLSKFENYNKEMNKELIMLLLDRLNISVGSIQKVSESLGKELNNLLDAIIYYDKDRAKQAYQQVKELHDYIRFTDYTSTYHLYLYRYYLLMNDMKSAQKERNFIKQIANSFGEQEKELFQYISAANLILKCEYKQALDILLKVEMNDLLPSSLRAELYYFVALIYGHLKDHSGSVAYGFKALEEYSRSFNYLRILHTQFLLGIAYANLGLYESAEEQYQYIFRNLKLLQAEELTSTMYNNYALLLEKVGREEEASTYFRLSMKHAKNDTEYCTSLCSYAKLLINQGKEKQALKKIPEILRKTNNKQMKKQYLNFKYYQLLLRGREEEAVHFLESEVLPYLSNGFYIEDYNKYVLFLADYYATRDKNKSYDYYKKIAEG